MDYNKRKKEKRYTVKEIDEKQQNELVRLVCKNELKKSL